jgi:hypothetical protein
MGTPEELTAIFKANLEDKIMSRYSSAWDFSVGSGPLCQVTATGGLECPGIADIKTTYGKARDTTVQIWNTVGSYFCQDCDAGNGIVITAGTDRRRSATVALADVTSFPSTTELKEIDISFGFSDASFGATRFAAGVFPKNAGASTGFLSPDACQVIENSLDIGYAKILHSEYDLLSAAEQKSFNDMFAAELELTSVMSLTSSDSWAFVNVGGGSPVEPKDASQSHTFDQARFRMRVEFDNAIADDGYDMGSVRESFAVAWWQAVATVLAPEYAQNEVNKYTSTTTTSATTTTITATTTTKFFNVSTDFTEEQLAEIKSKDMDSLRAELLTLQDALTVANDALIAALAACETDAATPCTAEQTTAIAAARTAKVAAFNAADVKQNEIQFKNEDAIRVAESGTEDGGLPIIPILGGCGFIIILLIVAVIMKGGGGGGGDPYANGQSDRNVVAFENPMYDDPAADTMKQNPMAAEEEDDDGGLYDEPAFNAEEEPDAGGGYLDVQPDEEEDAEEEEEEEEAAEEEASSEEESSEEESDEDDE